MIRNPPFPGLIAAFGLFSCLSAPVVHAESLGARIHSLYGEFSANTSPEVGMPPLESFELVARTVCKLREEYATASKIAWVDYSLPSDQKRLILFDFDSRRVLARTFATHGSGSAGHLHFFEEDPSGGIPYSRRKVLGFGSISETRFFSLEPGSNQSSLGLALADPSSYVSPLWGDPALRMSGLEAGLNSTLRRRGVVFHSFSYHEDQVLRARASPLSEGCLMLPGVEEARKWIDELKNAFVVMFHERLISKNLNEESHEQDLEVHQALRLKVRERLQEMALDLGWSERLLAERTEAYDRKLEREWLNRANETYRLMRKGSRFVGAQLRDETRCFPEVTGRHI